MDCDDLQFYPTPPTLAARAWAKFTNRNFVRVIEPSAGDGALADGRCSLPAREVRGDRIEVDCCEIDISKHPVLRAKGYRVVGVDFLQFESAAQYSHCVLNPPFRTGVDHVLKAWQIMWDGEIVAILNAESIRNPFSKERRMLVSLVEDHGDAEFIEGAFLGEDVERKALVDVALVHLTKRADLQNDLYGDLIGKLRKDREDGIGLAAGADPLPQALALPASDIENAVLAFDAAVHAMRDAALAEKRAAYYARLLGDTLSARCGNSDVDRESELGAGGIQRLLHERYSKLKDRAWAGILRSTNVTSRLSSKAQRRLESSFEEIKELSFTASNIYGFLRGLVENQSDMLIGMACDVFDEITRYHTENTLFFKGWVSNDIQRRCGMRIKATRFIIPGHHTESYQHSLSWDSERRLADFDKVFAALDGRSAPEVSLVDVFRQDFRQLRNGARVSSTYFDVRYYPGIGTIHFFPKKADVVDRLNRLVGRHRKWLPDEGEQGVSEGFWHQYERADKYDKEIRAELARRAGRSLSRRALYRLEYGGSEERDAATREIDDAAAAVLEKHGINIAVRLEHRQSSLPALAATPAASPVDSMPA